jgi:hypothetical protein
MGRSCGALLLLALVPAAALGARIKKTPILSLDTVKVTVSSEKDRTLRLEATGKVETEGWTDAKLARVIPLTPPPDGIYDVEALARKPMDDGKDGVIPIAIPILTWRVYPKEVKAIRFKAEKNCIIAVLPGVDKATIAKGDCTLM